MKIAIISDSHDNKANIKKFLAWAKENKIELIIHCGDISSAETIELFSVFTKEILIVLGNMDQPRKKEINDKTNLFNIEVFDPIGKYEIDNLLIGFTHFPDLAKDLALSGYYQMVFYGHTHKPMIEKINNCSVINPGTLGGVFNKASFAYYDSDSKQLDLILLEKL